ncbi:MAG: protease pro-enzyme activation domain-containing protein [Terracidiphilus sp.]
MKTIFGLSRQRRLWICGWIAACTLAASPLGAQSVAPRISSEINNSERAALTRSLHPMAQARFDAGRMAADTKLNGISLYFSRSPEQQADLEALIAAQQDPASPLYHQWLTPDQFAARFGMAGADLDKVKSWLGQQGFSVDSVARSRNMIRFSGTAGQVERAFSTQMHYYNVDGKQHFAPSTELSVPAALAPVILAVSDLNDFRLKPMFVRPARPDFTSSQSGNVHFAPGDIKVAYNIPSNYTGAGQSIAIMGQSAIETSDIENFQSAADLTVKDPTLVLVPGTGSSAISSGDESESDIDLEWSGAIAPGANIFFVYTGPLSAAGVFDSAQYAVDEDIAPIISISYGACETGISASEIAPYEASAQQAAAQGQSIVASSGDSGSTSCYGDNLTLAQQEVLSVNYPASSAYVTAMGGTEITSADDVTGTGYWEAVPSGGSDILTSALKWIPEVAWNDDVVSVQNGGGLSASGGGPSALITKPKWQDALTPADSARDVPDVSLYSSPNYPGYLFCSSDTSNSVAGSCANGFRDANDQYLTVAGGTSFAAPAFAGMLALINQAKGYTNGQGLINPTLYTLAADGATYASAFHDVTAGSSAGTTGLGNACLAGSGYCSSAGASEYPTATGYDLATGLGSVNLGNLIGAWPASSSTLTGTSTTISATNSAPALNVTDTFTITVTAVGSTTTPSGSVNLSIDGGGTPYSNGGTTTTVALVASGVAGTATATYQTSFSSAGTHQIVAQYPGDTTFAVSTGVVQVSVAGSSSGKGTFALSASPSTLTVSQGSQGTEVLTVTPAGGYAGTVLLAFDSSNDSALQNLCYEFTTMLTDGDGSVAVSGAGAVTTQLLFDTNATDCASAAPVGGKPFHRLGGTKTAQNNGPKRAPLSPAPFGAAFAGLLLAGFLGRHSRKFYSTAMILALLTLGLAVSACGGGGGGGGGGTTVTDPPKGTYTITVTGQDSATATITGQTTFTFVID